VSLRALAPWWHDRRIGFAARFNARMMPMRANIVGPPDVTTRITHEVEGIAP
jgi:hypothetical protein